MARPRGIFTPAAACACLAICLAWVAPAPAPTAASAAEVGADIGTAVRQLTSPDPRNRQAARQRLLQTEVEDLATIAAAAADLDARQKALPDLRQTLEEVVHQVILRRAKQEFTLSGDATFFRGRPLAFFGIQLYSEEFNAVVMPSETGPGITVASALPGFRAYEHFEEGDVMLAARLDPEEEFQTLYHLGSLNNLLNEIAPEHLMNFRQSVVLEVLTLRAGRLINIPFRLDVRIETNDPAFLRSQQQAAQKARNIWETEFTPIFSARAAGGSARRGVEPRPTLFAHLKAFESPVSTSSSSTVCQFPGAVNQVMHSVPNAAPRGADPPTPPRHLASVPKGWNAALPSRRGWCYALASWKPASPAGPMCLATISIRTRSFRLSF